MNDLRQRITFNPNQCGGRPCIRGMRIRVSDVLDLLANGLTKDEILAEMPDLEADDIRAALVYAAQDEPPAIGHMILIDAQLSPMLAAWIAGAFGVESRPVRDLNLRDAEDSTIFQFARTAGTIVMTKDEDFVSLLERHGPPPQILWITCGNTSNEHLRRILNKHLAGALQLLAAGEPLVEISGE